MLKWLGGLLKWLFKSLSSLIRWLPTAVGGRLDANERETKRLQPLVDRVNALEPDFERLSDAELRGKTDQFKARFQERNTLDELLTEAFPAVREARTGA